MVESNELQLRDYIRAIPDFPKPGILFRDITTLLSNSKAFHQAVTEMTVPFREMKIDAIAAAEARGFLFAAPMALALDAALIPIRKPGKLPHKTLSFTYDLEYGSDTLEIHADAITPGMNVLIVDDLLATGGTVEACCHIVEKAGGTIVGCSFLIELAGLEGAKRIAQHKWSAVIQYD